MIKKILLGLGALIIVLAMTLAAFLSGGPTLPPNTNVIIEQAIESGPSELVIGQTGIATSGNVKIWYEVIAPKGTPKATVLLIMGAASSGLFWRREYIDPLVAAGYRVIRYDYRGLGMSDWMQDWSAEQPYTLEDLAVDALAVLDAAGVRRAHVIGTSMGGMVGQRLAISYPGRVLSLTSMSSSGYLDDPELAKQAPDFLLNSIRLVLKYGVTGSEAGLIKMVLGFKSLMLSDELRNEDVKPVADIVLYEIRKRRGLSPYAVAQHFAAIQASGSRLQELSIIKVPTLVIHGKADPILSFSHAEKYARLIPDVRTLWIDDAGHIFRREHMPQVIRAILQNFIRAEQWH
ncbi:MAG: lipase/esterase LipG [Gammaproteobacteria bacterium]|nr:MAG: lipase/esterase LipG [Gammaproteobacteria bacterium]